MSYDPDNALIIQSDRSILLDLHAPKAADAQQAIAPFAELIKSPEHIHTYRLTALSIWNARAAGLPVATMIQALADHAKYPMPESVAQEIEVLGSRYGLTTLTAGAEGLELHMADEALAELLLRHEQVGPFLTQRLSKTHFAIALGDRGLLKQSLLIAGYPAQDLAGYLDGDALEISLRSKAKSGDCFQLRPYQQEAADLFYQAGTVEGGSGVIVLPCGAGENHGGDGSDSSDRG